MKAACRWMLMGMIAGALFFAPACQRSDTDEQPQIHVVSRKISTQESRLVLEFTFGAARLERKGRFNRVVVPGVSLYHGAVGSPVLPKRTFKILMPWGHRVESVTVDPIDTKMFNTQRRLEHRSDIRPLCIGCGDEGPSTGPDPEIYGREGVYPGESLKARSLQRFRGYSILYVDFFPVQYSPLSGDLTQTLRGRISIITRLDETANGEALAMLRSTHLVGDRRDLLRKVDDAGFISTFALPFRTLSENQPAGDTYEYLIITSERLAAANGDYTFEDLLDHKIKKGLTGRIVTREEIEKTQSGIDIQQKIRNFIRDSYQHHGTRYVLLAGDSDVTTDCSDCEAPVVPHRGLFSIAGLYYVDRDIPADCYYANLDGPFDGDGDGLWGEPTDGIGGGDVDLIAEVAVGRAPVDSMEEVSNFVRKTLAYENRSPPDLVYMIGEYLWDKSDGTPNYGGDSKDEIVCGSSLGGHQTRGFSDLEHVRVRTLYERDGEWSASDLVDAANNAGDPVHLFNHLGHSINNYNMKLYTSDLKRLQNEFPFFVFSQGCYPGAFDNIDHYLSPQDSIGEHLVVDRHGAFAVVQNSRYGWGSRNDTLGPSQFYDREFFDAVIGEGITRLGEALNRAKEKNITDIGGPAMRWCYYELNLLGDPQTALKVHEDGCWPRPHADAGVDRWIAHGESVQIGTAALPEHEYSWSPPAGLSCSDCAQPVASPSATATFTITATTACGSATDTVTVHVDENLPPSVDITSPKDGDIVKGTVTIEAVAGDPDGHVARVVFGLPDGQSHTVTEPPYVEEWDSTLVGDGERTITAVAYDDQDVSSEMDAVSVTVKNDAGAPGDLRWSYDMGSAVYSSPAIGDDGTIYITSGRDVLAVSPDGTERWRVAREGCIFSSPAVGGDGTIYVGSSDEELCAIAPDGTVRWSFTAGGDIDSAPAIGSDGTIYAGSNDHNLYAINPDGTLKWAYLTGSLVLSSPAIGVDGTVYVGSWDKNLYAINPDGTLRWSVYVGGAVSSPALGGDGTVYVGSSDGLLHAVGPDGDLKWSYQTGGDIYTRFSPSVGSDGTIYVGSRDKKLYAVNSDGTLEWSYVTGDGLESSPAIASDGTIYVGSRDDSLYAIGPDGATRWRFATERCILSSPTIGTDGTVYVGSVDGKLYAIFGDAPLADSSWPKFRANRKNTGNVNVDENLPPSVSITSPRDGDTIEGVVTVEAVAGDPDGHIARVVFGLPDGQSITVTELPYVEEWDSTSVGDGEHVITAVAYDDLGAPSEADAVSVTVSNNTGVPGELRWSYDTDTSSLYGIRTASAIGEDGTIYVGAGYDVFAIAPDGTLEWNFTTESFVSDSVALGGDGTIYAGSCDNHLYAIRPDGTIRWKFPTSLYISSSPVIGSDGTIYVAETDKKLYAVNPDGTLGWIYHLGDRPSGSPAIGGDGTIYLGTWDFYLYAIYPDGTLRWRFRSTGGILSSPAIGSDGTLYVGSESGRLYAIRPDGVLGWSYLTSDPIRVSPAVGSDGTIYVGTSGGELHAVNPDGTRQWEFETDGKIFTSAALGVDGTIYFGSRGGNIYAIERDGTLKWRLMTGEIYHSSPTIGTDGTVYVGSLDGRLYAVVGDTALADSPWPKFLANLENTGRR